MPMMTREMRNTSRPESHRHNGRAGTVPERGGQKLDLQTRRYFESALGADLGGVRIYTEAASAALARSIQASAFSVGHDIHFGEGRFRPHAEEGRNLLAHELIHVLQQRHVSLGAETMLAPRDHPLERNASDVAAHDTPIARADRPMILRSGEGDTHQPLNPGLGNTPQLSVGGHTIAGDTHVAQSLLQSQLSMTPLIQPLYFGTSMTLQEIATVLRTATPALTDATRLELVQSAWWQKVYTVRQLPPISRPLQLPMPSLRSGGAGVSSVPPVTRVLPTPEQAAANYYGVGLPDRASNSGVANQEGTAAPSTPGDWSPSAGPQVLVNITRGSGIPPAAVAGQRQYTLGDNFQVVFQDSTDAASRTYSVAAGGQALTKNMIDSEVVKLQAFTQLLAGLSQMPGSLSASMTVQWSGGMQLTLVFGPVTIQLSAGVQVTGQQGQSTQGALAFQAMAGPTNPAPGTGSQEFGPRNNWFLGIGPPPPMATQGAGGGGQQLGGGLLYGGFHF